MLGFVTAPLAAVVIGAASIVSNCCGCDALPADCGVIIGWPDQTVAGERQGPYNLVDLRGFTYETWKMNCGGRVRVVKIDQSPNLPTDEGHVVLVTLHWPPDRAFWGGDYTWDNRGCWGQHPNFNQWETCYIFARVEGM